MHVRGALREEIRKLREKKKLKKKTKDKKVKSDNAPRQRKADKIEEEKFKKEKTITYEDEFPKYEKNAANSRKWEYHVFYVKGDYTKDGYRKEFVKKLNKLGNDGWEVISVLSPQQDPEKKYTMLFLKREIAKQVG